MVLLTKKSAPLPPLDAYVSGYADRHTCAFCIEPTRRSKTGFVTLGPDLVYVFRNTIRLASKSVNVSRRQYIYFLQTNSTRPTLSKVHSLMILSKLALLTRTI